MFDFLTILHFIIISSKFSSNESLGYRVNCFASINGGKILIHYKYWLLCVSQLWKRQNYFTLFIVFLHCIVSTVVFFSTFYIISCTLCLFFFFCFSFSCLFPLHNWLLFSLTLFFLFFAWVAWVSIVRNQVPIFKKREYREWMSKSNGLETKVTWTTLKFFLENSWNNSDIDKSVFIACVSQEEELNNKKWFVDRKVCVCSYKEAKTLVPTRFTFPMNISKIPLQLFRSRVKLLNSDLFDPSCIAQMRFIFWNGWRMGVGIWKQWKWFKEIWLPKYNFEQITCFGEGVFPRA